MGQLSFVEQAIIFLVIGCILGFVIRDRRAKKVLAQLRRQATGQIEGLRRQVAERGEKDQRRQHYRQENDLSDPENQLRFVGEAQLRAVSPVNREAASVLYAIDEWLKVYQPDWRFGFEVSMGGFIKTSYDPEDARQKRHLILIVANALIFC